MTSPGPFCPFLSVPWLESPQSFPHPKRHPSLLPPTGCAQLGHPGDGCYGDLKIEQESETWVLPALPTEPLLPLYPPPAPSFSLHGVCLPAGDPSLPRSTEQQLMNSAFLQPRLRCATPAQTGYRRSESNMKPGN